MEAELMSLAAAGATVFVQQMAADSWAEARDRIVSFLSRRDCRGETVIQGELETSRGELAAAMASGDEQTAADIEAEWRTRLRRTLLDNPVAASELRAVLDELAAASSGQLVAAVHNTINGGMQHGPRIASCPAGRILPLTTASGPICAGYHVLPHGSCRAASVEKQRYVRSIRTN
ncbi:hypothetical protein AB0D57_40530 [Streptomyces sp. NPDC048275]|uniref:hypothetical protein n=1 Tax=Streptomyces sp. NPDC048275 TaxID=3155629 RepID=UPI0033E95996